MSDAPLELDPRHLPDELPGLVEELQGAFAAHRRILVLSHDNPDPDALASAFLLARVLETLVDGSVTVAYAGIIGRAENRAMLRELELEPTPLAQVDTDDFDAIALVDTQPGAGNNSLPSQRLPTAIIDHHPLKCRPEDHDFVDIRESYGASATMIAEYAAHCAAPLSPSLATAVFYAIRSETQDLGREAGESDLHVYMALFPRADVAALSRIQRARVPREYFRAFRTAIDEARVHGRTVLTDLRRVESPDIVAEIADFLLRLEGIDWACSMGRHDEQLVASLRTSQPDAHAGRIIRAVVAGHGTAGGHGMSAGGQVPLDEGGYEAAAKAFRQRLLEELDITRAGEPLVIAR